MGLEVGGEAALFDKVQDKSRATFMMISNRFIEHIL